MMKDGLAVILSYTFPSPWASFIQKRVHSLPWALHTRVVYFPFVPGERVVCRGTLHPAPAHRGEEPRHQAAMCNGHAPILQREKGGHDLTGLPGCGGHAQKPGASWGRRWTLSGGGRPPPPAQEPQAQACVLGPHPAPWPPSETATSLTVRELSFLGYLCLNKTFIHLLSILIDLIWVIKIQPDIPRDTTSATYHFNVLELLPGRRVPAAPAGRAQLPGGHGPAAWFTWHFIRRG